MSFVTDKKNPDISVVIPVYNVGKYLRECLDSIILQTFPEWECICVDDGSTDSSLAILDEYAAKDSRFSVIRGEHSNAGHCRNVGLDIANGRYLLFLDSDDVFSPDLFEVLLSGAEKNNADIAACSSKMFIDGSPVEPDDLPEEVIWEETSFDSVKNPFMQLATMPWNKLFRTAFVRENGLRYLEQVSTNDFTFCALAIALSSKSVVTDLRLVMYRQHASSIQAHKSKNPENYLHAVGAVCDILKASKRTTDAVWWKFAEVFVGGLNWELKTQTTAKAYFSLQRMSRDFEKQYSLSGKMNKAFSKYYRSIIGLSLFGKLRSCVDAVLYCTICKGGHVSGFRAVIAKLIN